MMIGARSCVVIFLACLGLAAAEVKNVGWWKNTVFYQIYPRSFMDSNNDGVGDLKGVTMKLDHFVDAGIGAIWLSPINKSPMVDFGYDIADFRDVDKAFGTLDDFQELIKEAKARGLRVILDLVPNHTSNEHEWFKRSVLRDGKYTDYYLWADGKSATIPPNNWLSVFGGIGWTYHNERKQWYFHQFHEKQPDLNYRSPYVRQEMEEIIEYWLKLGIEGFRVDAIPHLYEVANITLNERPVTDTTGIEPNTYPYLNHTLTKDQPETYEVVKSWSELMTRYANLTDGDEKVMMTEAYTSLENTVKYYHYGAQIPFNFNFIMELDNKSTADDFKAIIDNWMNAMPNDGVANWVIGNHDRSRVASRYPGRVDQMTMLAMILPGVAVTYNGEEIGMEDKSDISFEDTQDPQGRLAGEVNYKTKSRDPNRTPFQWDDTQNAGFSKAAKTWLPVHENYKTLNLKAQKAADESHYKVYKALINLRKTSYALQTAPVKAEVLNNKNVLAVTRSANNDTVTLLINFSDKDNQTVNLSEMINGKTLLRLASVGSGQKADTELDPSKIFLPARASIVAFTVTNGAASVFNSLSIKLVSIIVAVLFMKT